MSIRSVPLPISADLAAAREVIARALIPTPLIAAPAAGERVWIKAESFQPSGSFKVRGALAAATALPAGCRIVTASAGNHALGIAFAAGKLGIPATIVVPGNVSPAKRAALEALPIELIVHGDDYDAVEAYAMSLAADPVREAIYVSPYNDPHVIAGQSTIVDELVAQLPGDRPLTIVAGVGGGGLVAGLSLRARELTTTARPIRVIGVEAAQSVAVSRAIAAGQTYEIPIGETIADGLSGNLEPGSITVGLIAEHTDALTTVTEDELATAIRWLARQHGLVAEGAAAAATAAFLAGKISPEDGDLVLLLTGRNIALPKLASVLVREDLP